MLRKLEPGEIFGEVGLLFKCSRSATVFVTDFAMYGKVEEHIM